jgi:hypothetical protein
MYWTIIVAQLVKALPAFKELDITLQCPHEHRNEPNDKLDISKTRLLEINLNILKPYCYVLHQQV